MKKGSKERLEKRRIRTDLVLTHKIIFHPIDLEQNCPKLFYNCRVPLY